MRGFLIVLLVACGLGASASNKVLNIGLFWNNEPSEVTVQTSLGSYSIYGNGKLILDLKESAIVRILNQDGLIHVRTITQDLGTFYNVEIKRTVWGSSLKIQPKGDRELHEYNDNFSFKPFQGKLRIVNEVYIEHYVAGVIEGEAGIKEPKEYYKVQAVICRTYALNNRRRHEAEGFQLCDKVHCQVYHRRSMNNPDIVKGTQETIGIVIVDSDINLVTAAFHSNCGGYTCNSEDVWSGYLNYLRAREDEHCLQENHSYWRTAFTRDKWLNYLSVSHGYPVYEPTARDIALDYCPDERQHYLNPDGFRVHFKRIRYDLGLQSAFFSIDAVQDSVILEGHGYGHGVGLCQEGAMNMAKSGQPYDDILHYYYREVHLVNLSVIDFFRAN
ncbi:MAG: SpoIID/LytB domain-containing protein [Flavobacteriales bacterium]|nr:SpoIID/LytB domain-containing protein [Flavobacteriales bacterium]